MISYSDFLKGGGAKCKFTKLWHRLEKYNRSWDPGGGGGCMTVLGDKPPPLPSDPILQSNPEELSSLFYVQR